MPEKTNFFEIAHSKLEESGNIIAVKLTESCFDGASISVKHTLNMASALGFIRAVASDCFDYDEAEYTPEVFDFSVRLRTIEAFTDLEPSENMDLMFDILYRTSLFDVIYERVDQAQFNTLVSQAQDMIAFNRRMMISTAAQQIKEIVDKIGAFTNSSEKLIDFVGSSDFTDLLSRVAPQPAPKKKAPRKKKASAKSEVGTPDNVIQLKKPEPDKAEQDG